MSTSTPLSVPLHFASSSRLPIDGPTVPQDWQYKWHRSDYPRPAVEVEQGYDDEWSEEKLDKWVTCLAVWDDEAVGSPKQDEPSSRQSASGYTTSGPTISVADENGETIGESSESKATPAMRKRTIGGRRSGKRIAMGLQNGTIWLFQEKATKFDDNSSAPLASASRVRSPSRNSISSISVASPSLTSISGNNRGMEIDDVRSPISPVAGTSDVNASGSAVRNSSVVDAEESLETQWHAGTRENHTVVGGMMEVLRLNHSNQQHTHSHPHQHNNSHTNSQSQSGSSTPYTPSHQKRSLQDSKKASRASLINYPLSPPNSASGRSRAASAATVSEQCDTDSIAEYEGNERIRLSRLMNGTRHRHDSAATQSTEGDNNVVKVKAKEFSGQMEILVALQCSSNSPIVSLVKTATGELASLQEDGGLVMWSLQDATQVRSINLKISRSAAVETAPPIHPPTLAVASNPLSALAALRSGSNTPIPRSRANSNATQPGKTVSELVSGICRMHSMQAIKAFKQNSTPSLLLCFDDIQKRVMIVDAVEARVVMTQTLQDCSSISPSARFINDGENVELYFITAKNSVALQTIRIASAKSPSSPIELNKQSHLKSASAFLRREGISNANSRAPSIAEERDSDVVDLGKAGLKEEVIGLEMVDEDLFLSWTRTGVQLLRKVAESLIVRDTAQVAGLQFVSLGGDSFTVQCEVETVLYSIKQGTQLQLKTRFPTEDLESLHAFSTFAGSAFQCSLTDDNKLMLKCNEDTVWRGEKGWAGSDSSLTASLPYSMERVLLSLSRGHLVMSSLADLASGKLPELPSTQRHKGSVNLLRLVVNPRTQVRHVVGGTEEGDVIFWDATTLKKQSERSLLTCPVVDMVVLGKEDNTLRLNGCLACVGADGSLVMFLLDGLQDLYTIPGRGVPLEKLAVRADELLLIYDDSRARVWDMRTLELRRSIGIDQALALLDDGKGWWSQHSLGASQMKVEKGSAGVLASVPTSRCVAAGTMTANLRRAIEAASRMVTPLQSSIVTTTEKDSNGGDEVEPTSTAGDQLAMKRSVSVSMTSVNGKKALHTLRPLMHSLMPIGLDEEGNDYCKKVLGVNDLTTTAWLRSGTCSPTGHLALAMQSDSPKALLSMSPIVTTTRLLGLTAMLLVISNIDELQSTCFELLTLLGSLPALVGETYHPPCLAMLTDYITDSVTEIQQAAQTLFTTTLEAMSQEQVDELCEEWTPHLPSRNGGQQSSKALLLLGLIATERYTMLPPTLLKDVANSITLFMREDANPAHQSTAIMLCDRGFTIFQHYFDAMDIVRSLFSLSTSKSSSDSKEEVVDPPSPITIQNRALARKATLQIAEDNTPLFMTTLSLDILHAQSPAHCNATMRLVALMVRKKPLILYPNLPRLAEAVVKSLDPTVTSLRSVVHRSATIIISELIATYPTISFQKELQRLAVGTFEGAIIMYDLKTSTRLYVIEAHQSSLSGLSFSQDGRRLISISLKERKVKVWKTGVGFSAFLSFGGAPRQGGLLSSALSSNVVGGTAANANNATTTTTTTNNNTDATGSSQAGKSNVSKTVGTAAYKSFEFGRIIEEGQEDSEREAVNLALIGIQWVGQRSIRINVGETSMAFDVA